MMVEHGHVDLPRHPRDRRLHVARERALFRWRTRQVAAVVVFERSIPEPQGGTVSILVVFLIAANTRAHLGAVARPRFAVHGKIPHFEVGILVRSVLKDDLVRRARSEPRHLHPVAIDLLLERALVEAGERPVER
jgi:hypothetical protein